MAGALLKKIDALPDDSRLCEVCRCINFASYFQQMGEGVLTGEEDGDKPLGTRMEIRKKASSCDFCFLADTTLNDHPWLAYDEDPAVGIKQHYLSDNCDPDPNVNVRAFGIQLVGRRQGTSALFSCDIQLLADDAQKLGLSPLFHGREMHQTRFNISMAIKWINICRTRHGSLCDLPGRHPEERIPAPQPVGLLAIDLNDMCVCNMPAGSEFAALSYCWPGSPGLVLEQSNYHDLSGPRGLLRHMHLLPGTVQDAISCAKELSFRYLWVDALCIIQDDHSHKEVQLRQMDRVYGAAFLTIVCAYPVARGTRDNCSGLPRYNKNIWPRSQLLRSIKGLRMTAMTRSLDDIIDRSRWSTRCWTFQEYHLSRRILLFTHVQVFFQCPCSVFCEDVVCEDARHNAYHAPGSTLWNSKARYDEKRDHDFWGEWNLSRAPAKDDDDKILTYEYVLSEYTSREVSFQSDFLNAFEGVAAVLAEHMETEFWQGLPERYFDLMLLWQVNRKFRRRTPPQPITGDQSHPLSSSGPLFPSWSWAEWESHVSLPMWTQNYMKSAGHRSEVEWFIMRDDGVCARLDIVRDASKGNVPVVYSAHGNKNVASRPLNVDRFLSTLLPRSQINIKSKEWKEARTLACYTTRASFYIDGMKHRTGTELYFRDSINLAIKDAQGSVAGCILVCHDFASGCSAEPRVHDFILISRSLSARNDEYSPPFDESVYTARDWCTLNVMLVEQSNNLDDVQRVGVGIIHEDAWVRADPKETMVRIV